MSSYPDVTAVKSQKVVVLEGGIKADAPIGQTKLFAWVICGLGALFYCYEYLLRISPSVMSTDLMRAHHIDAAAFGNLAAFYYYAYTPMQLPVGVLMDHYGPRRLLIFACLVCAIGSYFFANHHSLGLAQLGRFLVGFGSAFAFVGVLKLATIWLPPSRFAMIAGFTTTLGMLGASLGDLWLPALVRLEGWRSTIIMSAIAGIVIALAIGLVMPDTSRQLGKPQKSTFADLKLLFVGLRNLFKNPYIWLNGLVGCLLYLPLSAFAELWGIPYLEGALHYSRMDAASMISVVFVGWAIGAPAAGWISDKLQRRCLPIMLGGLLSSAVIAAVLYVPHLSKLEVSSLLFLFGMFSSAQVIVFAIGREVSPGNLAGTALAFTNMLVMLGGVLFQPVIGRLLDLRWDGHVVNHVPVYSGSDYQFALMALPVGTLLAGLLMFIMKETRAKVS